MEQERVIETVEISKSLPLSKEGPDDWKVWSEKVKENADYKNGTVRFKYQNAINDAYPFSAQDVEKFFLLCGWNVTQKRNLHLELYMTIRLGCSIPSGVDSTLQRIEMIENKLVEQFKKVNALPNQAIESCSVFLEMENATLNEVDRLTWVKCYPFFAKILKEKGLTINRSIRTINVRIQEDFEINNLRYAFPLMHHFENLHLTVNDLGFRCRSLFYWLQKNVFSNNRITIKGSGQGDASFASDLFPCLAINDQTIATVFDEPLTELVEQLFKENKKKSEALLALFNKSFFGKRDIGDKDATFGIDDAKEQLLKLFGDKLSAIVFLYLLRCHSSYQDDSMSDDDLLRILQTDSKSYAEGLWQIIENAWKHSAGKTAFFGMRVYKADTTSPMNKLQKRVATRTQLWNKYWINKFHNSSSHIFQDKTYKGYLEFYVIDDAIPNANPNDPKRGIVDMINVNQFEYKSDGTVEPKIKSISEIFELGEQDYPPKHKLDYYIKHYGMQWLKRHVDKSDGIYEIYSPCDCVKNEPYACWYSNTFYTNADDKNVINNVFRGSSSNWQDLYFTEYAILIPLPSKQKPLGMGSVLEYDFSAEPPKNKNWLSIKQDIGTEGEDKTACIDGLINDICPTESFYTLYKVPEKTDALGIEILAKAIFWLIYEKNNSGDHRNEKWLFALLFEGHEKKEAQIGEFVRIFSVFYQKLNQNTGDSRNRMDNVQIALCSKDKDGLSNVDFVLAGSDFAKAYQTASNYVYYNRNSIPYVRLLDYLNEKHTDQKDENSADQKDEKPADQTNTKSAEVDLKLYPFDLYLSDN